MDIIAQSIDTVLGVLVVVMAVITVGLVVYLWRR
jgi:hypothetical protein